MRRTVGVELALVLGSVAVLMVGAAAVLRFRAAVLLRLAAIERSVASIANQLGVPAAQPDTADVVAELDRGGGRSRAAVPPKDRSRAA